MNYAGKAEQLLLSGQGQTEVPYSTEEQRLAAAQVLALLTLAEAIQDLGASIDMGLRGDGGSGIGKAIESALGVAHVRHQASSRRSRTWPPPGEAAPPWPMPGCPHRRQHAHAD